MVLTYSEWEKVQRDMKRRKSGQCKKKFTNIRFIVMLWRKCDGTTKRISRVESAED